MTFTQLVCTLVNLIVLTQEVAVPEVLYEEVIEVDERVVLRQDGCQLPKKDPKRTVTGAKQLPVFFPKSWNASNSAKKNILFLVHFFCPGRMSQP